MIRRKRFNWLLAIVLLMSLVILVLGAFAIRKWQRNRMAYDAKQIGLQAYEKHLWQIAAKNLGRYLVVDNQNVSILLKYAQAQFNIRPVKRGNIQQAIAAYRSVFRIDPANIKAAENLVNIYLQMGIPAEAELIATRFLETNKSSKIRLLLGQSLVGQRKNKQAKAQFLTVVKENPAEIEAYEMLGWLTEFDGDTGKTKTEYWFDKAVSNNPSSSAAYIARAAFHLRKQRKDDAIADLKKAEQFDLSDLRTHIALAEQFADADALQKALSHLSKIYAISPNNLKLWQTWAIVASKMVSKEEMLKVAKMGLKELEPHPWEFMPIAAEFFIRCGEFEQAQRCLDKLDQRDIEHTAVTALRGLLAKAKKQDQKAIDFWRQAKQMGSESENMGISLADALEKCGDRQSAILQLRQMLSEHPNSFAVHFNLAKLLAQNQNLKQAMHHAQLATQIAPNNIDAVLLYIQTQIQLAEYSNDELKEQMFQRIEKLLGELTAGEPNVPPEINLLRFRIAIQKQRLDDAQKLIDELKASHYDSLKIDLAQIDLLIAQNKTEQAISKLQTLVELHDQAVLPVRYLASLMLQYRGNDHCQKVLEQAAACAKSPLGKRQLGLMLAQFYEQTGQHDKSFQSLKALSEELESDIVIKRWLIKCQRVQKNPKLAQKIVDDIKTLDGLDGWQWRWEQARLWFLGDDFKSRYPQIITLLKENLVTNPEDLSSRLLLATTYQKAGDLQLAAAAYLQALNRAPEDVRIIAPAVSVLYSIKEYEKADKILSRVEDNQIPSGQISILKLAGNLRRGQLDSAQTIVNDSIAADPNNDDLRFASALLKMRQGKFAESEHLLNSLKDNLPDSKPVFSALVRLNVRQEKFDKALTFCDQMVQKFNTPDSYLLRGQIYAMTGNYNHAKKEFKSVIEMDPNNLIAINNLAWILCENDGQCHQALELVKKGLKKTDNYPDLIDTCGVIYYRLANYQKAIQNFNRSIALYPNDSAAVTGSYFHLARAQARINENSRAVDNLRKAIQLNSKIGGLNEDDLNEAKIILNKLSGGKL